MTLDTFAISDLDADDPAAVEAAFRIGNEANQLDMPDYPPDCRYAFEARLRVPWPSQRELIMLGSLDGVPVGLLKVGLPMRENLENVHLDVFVLPDARRNGVGRALYAHGAELGRAHGRKRALGFSMVAGPDGMPRGSASYFGAAVGQQVALTDIRRRLDLSTVDPADLARHEAAAWSRADGYSVVRWGNHTPEEYLADIAELDSSFMDETPTGELVYEAEDIDGDRVRQINAVREGRGYRVYNTGVLHEASGRLIAWSMLQTTRTVRWHAWQQITLVHPAHRGHRLGLLSKVVNLRYLIENEPTVRFIDTFNAQVNTHMIAINEALGFRVADTWANWQGDI